MANRHNLHRDLATFPKAQFGAFLHNGGSFQSTLHTDRLVTNSIVGLISETSGFGDDVNRASDCRF